MFLNRLAVTESAAQEGLGRLERPSGGGLSLRVSGLSDRTRRVFFFLTNIVVNVKSRESEEAGGETLTCGETF